MKPFAVAFCLLTLPLAPCTAQGGAAPPASQGVRAAYARLDAAYDRRDVPGIMALLAPGFVRRERNAVLTATQEAAELKDSFDGTVSVRATSQIQSLRVHGDGAEAAIARRVEFALPEPMPLLLPPYFAVKVTRERWRRTQGQWRMTDMEDTPLSQTLSLLDERDQGIRRRLIADSKNPALAAQMSQVDAADRARLKQIIRQGGWPGFDLAGTDGEADAFIIVQHSDEDRAFQERCLPLIQAAVGRGQAMPSDVAYLTDRLRVNAGQPQVYGTQGDAPTEDAAQVDQRRASVGLGPLAEYRRQLKQIYKPTPKP